MSSIVFDEKEIQIILTLTKIAKLNHERLYQKIGTEKISWSDKFGFIPTREIHERLANDYMLYEEVTQDVDTLLTVEDEELDYYLFLMKVMKKFLFQSGYKKAYFTLKRKINDAKEVTTLCSGL